MIRKAIANNAKAFLALQSLFYAFANGIEALVPILLAPVLTRMLDPTDYGIWVLFVTYATFMRPIVGLTSQDAIRMRFYDFDEDQLKRFTHTILFVMVVLALFVSAVTMVFSGLLAKATKFPEAWLISVVIAALLYEVFYTVLALQQFHNRRKAFLATQVAQALLSLVFIVAFLLAGWDWRGVVLGRMLSMALASLFSLRSLGFTLSSLLRIPERSFYRNIASFGVMYWPAGAVIMVVATTDRVVAAHYLGVEASAMLGVAWLFASAFWMVNYSFVMAWTPWLFRKLKNLAPGDLQEVVSVSAVYFVLAALAALAFYFFALLVAPIMLGEAFHSAIDLLRYAMLAILMQGYFMHNMKFLHFEKSIEMMSIFSVLTIALNYALSALWVGELGIAGILLATAVSFGAAFLISSVIVIVRYMNTRKGATRLAG
ncbi:MAG: oligosaccharide flippase family protein [Pseudomonadota bacterium]